MKRTRRIWIALIVISCLSCDKFDQVLSSALASENAKAIEFKVGTYVGTGNEYLKVGGNGYDSTVTNIFYSDTFDPLIFIDQFMQHVLPPYFQKTRRYGLHASATKKKHKQYLDETVKRNGQTVRTAMQIIAQLIKES